MDHNLEEIETLFSKHISQAVANLEESLADLSISGLLICAGNPVVQFEDDMTYPFITNHFFRYFCPVKGHGHVLVLRRSEKPLLLAFQPDDFWHGVEDIREGAYWANAFEIKIFSQADEILKYTQENFIGFQVHGDVPEYTNQMEFEPIAWSLLARMRWDRNFKTEFERACLREATRIAEIGHRAAKISFFDGGSELDIYNAFLQSTRTSESDLPYGAIVGLNKNAATLHYHKKDDTLRNANVLLIDAGAQFNNYASDITRTYATDKTDPEFIALLNGMEKAQLELCALVAPGGNHFDLNLASKRKVSELLVEQGLISGISIDQVVEEDLVGDFYPHSIGHLLGIHVHDVGGRQLSREQLGIKNPEVSARLRSLRRYEVGSYLTVEPGLYFIDVLLDARRNTDLAKHYNWDLIDRLKVYGGIRIEDDLLVVGGGSENMTREFFVEVDAR